mmetsp:Transcript_62751/g.147140  ORF Transcript_62751/g.147140 Transcript_62751/m.147140 type:complete len:542 (+) Transcript_62751:68-1693(+)
MNVTKANFAQVACELETLLPEIDFIAIDEEMTGIFLPGKQESIIDAPEVRYSKMKDVASSYSIIQFGVALFAKSSANDKNYLARAYNFYVFPEKGPVNMEASSVHFNSKNGMDWNAWIREGIPYLNREASAKLRAQLLPESGESDSKQRVQLNSAADIDTTSAALQSLKDWMNDATRAHEKEFEIVTTNAYLRRYMHETLQEHFPDLVVESRPTALRGMSTMVALRLSDEEKNERSAKIRAEKEAELVSKVGVRRIFAALANSKKPIVGHACLYDLMFAFSHFEGPLADSFREFKHALCGLFPTVYDTQLLARSDLFKTKPNSEPPQSRFRSFALGEVHKVLKEEADSARAAGGQAVEIALADGHNRYATTAIFHEAGYDAFITGCVFAYMAGELFSEADKTAEPFKGRLVMFRNFFNVNLLGDDELITKGSYLHTRGLKGRSASDFSSSLQSILIELHKRKNVEAEFNAPFQIRWIDDDSAFAVFSEESSGLIAEICDEAQAAGGDVGGLHFMPGETWFKAQAAETGAAEPPRKRARADP